MHHTIDVEHLSYRYPDGTAALQDVSLFISPGEKVALVGPNGSGKSTLLLHLNGILRGEGRVNVCSMPMTEHNLGPIRAAVGLVFQDPDDQLFSHSVFDDVAFGPLYMGLSPDEIHDRVSDGLRAVGLEGFERRVPHHLSSGEKKRVAIACVLAMKPEILVLDEPTAGLDPRARRELIALLDTLPQTMLIATHDMRMVADILTRMVVIDDGQIVADGRTPELMQQPEMLTTHGLEPAVPVRS